MNDLIAGSRCYRDLLLGESQRVLGLVDRERESPTYGCGDRTYWAWKFVDFARPRFQEAICYLAYLYGTEFPGNRYRGSDLVLEWIVSMYRFWGKLQHKDGSFDEAYPFERSFAATAFTTFYAAEGLALIGDVLSPTDRAGAQRTIERAASWLVRNDETHGVLSNHLAAGAGALLHAYKITNDARFSGRGQMFLNRILDRQSREGWYEEYGGADPGYQSHGSFYLVRCWQLFGDTTLRDSLRKAMAFLAYWVHPDGSFGGEYASRNTQTYYPAAFEMFAMEDDAAAWIARHQRAAVGRGDAVGLAGIDAFNYFPCLNNLVFAETYAADALDTPPTTEWGKPGLAWFPEAGMARMRTAEYDAFVGTTKGGVVKLFDRARRRLIYSDCGYVGRMRNGKRVSTQYADPERLVDIGDRELSIGGALAVYARPTMTPWSFGAFRLFTLTIGRLAFVARWLKQLLVRVLIYRRRTLGVEVRRTIRFSDSEIVVHDKFQGNASAIASLARESVFTTIHMGSSRYFVPNELDADRGTSDQVDLLHLSEGVALERRVRVE